MEPFINKIKHFQSHLKDVILSVNNVKLDKYILSETNANVSDFYYFI
ncbi:hypothetical protein [Mammaliicoccus sciuri]|nr:hypothetical protein [Mammaliicoccus sciuri]MEB6195225.1 hypothetical protein [Mammaliicoccus sciuri]